MTSTDSFFISSICRIRPSWVLKEFTNVTGQGIKIAVLDSGCEILMGNDPRILKGISFVELGRESNGKINDNSGDFIGHGTTCIDRILQIAPSASIIPVKIFDKVLETGPLILLEALKYAVESDINIINLSLSTALNGVLKPLYILCEEAKRNGIILVASNSNSNMLGFPAIFENVISVSSKRFKSKFDFSYRNDEYAECLADGSPADALSLDLKRIRSGGNSFAAPIISGFIALLLEKYGKLNIEEVRYFLNKYSIEKRTV